MSGFQYVPLGRSWQSFDLDGSGQHRAAEGNFLRRFERILSEWEGTPYVNGQSLKGVGTFCTAFVCSILDELYLRPDPNLLPNVPPDAAMHDPKAAFGGLRWFLRRYPNHMRSFAPRPLQPGDVLVTGPEGGGPGHGMLVGPRENTLWQCSGGSVHFTGMALPSPYKLFAVFRMTDRDQWLSNSRS